MVIENDTSLAKEEKIVRWRDMPTKYTETYGGEKFTVQQQDYQCPGLVVVASSRIEIHENDDDVNQSEA